MTDFRDISYSVLGTEVDPRTQGYQPVYDVVVASRALHGTASISQTLRNCRKLLRPGGNVVLLEQTIINNVAPGLIGTLTGHWDDIPDGRANGPFASLETWDESLKGAGFSGAELVLDNYPRQNNMITTLVLTLMEGSNPQ
ncbi:hypothetical protein FHL15_011324 [Xylaria flabelliformis]|uniref:Methyltransferase type 12 domain-containing protein n=1 Tax=Xylaria flabelliformis TaxID=2512241 RepID=A0A553HIL0_9PEZI|nr:hypothetical protein FHL15_011324 [Xylaria flabelliformis]